jgi:hypothetical protein
MRYLLLWSIALSIHHCHIDIMHWWLDLLRLLIHMNHIVATTASPYWLLLTHVLCPKAWVILYHVRWRRGRGMMVVMSSTTMMIFLRSLLRFLLLLLYCWWHMISRNVACLFLSWLLECVSIAAWYIIVLCHYCSCQCFIRYIEMLTF